MYNFNFNRLFNELFRMDDPFLNPKNFEKKTYRSEDGSMVFTYITNKQSNVSEDDEISVLKYKLDLAVESQDFEKAVELRDKIKKLEINKESIEKYNLELSESIKSQDFERCINLRDKIRSLK
jgi:protein-arginine kinase activator protein McsA